MAGIRGRRSKWVFFLPGPLYKTIYWLLLINFWKQVVKYPSLSAKQAACAPFIGFLSGTLNFFQTFFLSLSLFLLTSLSGWVEQLFLLWPALTVFLFLHFSSAVSCLCLSIISSPSCYKSVLYCCYYCSISFEKKKSVAQHRISLYSLCIAVHIFLMVSVLQMSWSMLCHCLCRHRPHVLFLNRG